MGKANGVGVAADVSAVGALVWVRRPNGSWWPGRVVSRLDVPDGCPAPPRSPATPIVLLGRRDGPAFVDWFNLERSKRVKPFRCGETELEECIRRAEEQAARRRRTSARYARKEDAVLQALDIERERLLLRSNTSPAPAPPPPPSVPARRKRKTPNDSEEEDQAPSSRRMRDLTDISDMKRTKLHNLPCGVSRKKDRSRPLSDLCNGTSSSPASQAVPLHQPVLTPATDQPVLAAAAAAAAAAAPAATILKPDNLHAHQPSASTKAPPTLECTKQASNCSKDGISSQCDSRNSKKITMSSVGHEGSSGNRTKNVSQRQHRKERVAKHKAAPASEVVLLEKRPEKTTAPDEDDKSRVVMLPDGLVRAALRQQYGTKCKLEEPSEPTDRHHSNGETGSVPPLASEPPPQHRDPRGHAVKPTKTLQLNPSLYDVELNAQGCGTGGKGRHVPLVSLMSRSSRRPVVGYPVSVEVLDAVRCRPPTPSINGVVGAVQCRPPAPRINGVVGAVHCRPPAPSINGVVGAVRCHRPAPSVVDHDHPPSTSSGANGLVKVKLEVEEEAAEAPRRAVPPQRAGARRSRRKAASEDEPWRPHTKEEAPRPARARSGRRKAAAEEDGLWRPHSKKPPVVSSPRKMRRLSSLGQRGGGGKVEEKVRRGAGELAVACVPVRVVFSRIKEALLSHPLKLKLK